MKLIRLATLATLSLMALAVVCGLLMPRQWHVERSIVVHAPPETIFPWIAEPRRWPEWLPWTKEKDPTLTFTFSGPESGVGAMLEWRGDLCGHVKYSFTRSDPSSGVAYEFTLEGAEI